MSWFWIGLLLLIALAAIPRFIVYDYGLPYLEYIDEVQLYWYSYAARGLPSLKQPNATYPPGIIHIYSGTQSILEGMGQDGPTATVHAIRLAAVLANLVGIGLIGLAARLLAGDLAGMVAAALWAFAPTVVDWSVLAIGESFVYPLVALEMLLVVGAWLHSRRWRWALASLGAALTILLFEYRLVVLLLPGLIVLAWRFGQRRQLDQRSWAWLVLGTMLLPVIGVGLIYLLVPRYSAWLTRVLTYDLWNFPLLLEHLVDTVNMLYGPGVLLLAGIGLIAGWRWRRVDGRLVLLLVVTAVWVDWLAAAVRWPADRGVRIQNILPAVVILCLLLGVSAAGIVARFRQRRLGLGIVLVILLGIGLVQIPALISLAQHRAVQNWQVIIREWADVNLTPGTVIVYNPHERTFNPYWGGIQGRKWFDWWPTEDILEHPLDEWIHPRGMSYALIPIPQYRQLQETAEGQALLNQMLHLRDFVHPPTRREAEGIFFRLWRMQHEADVRFGDHITLTGYDQSIDAIRPGESVDFTFYWNAPTTPEDNYSLFLHLVPDEADTVLAQVDGAPAVPERPTLTWDEPSETLISPTFTLAIPPDLPPGHYRVMLGLYNFQTGARLPVSGAGGAGGDATVLVEFDVEG